MARLIARPFDDPELDSILSGADWKILGPQESAKLKRWMLSNSAGHRDKQGPPQTEEPGYFELASTLFDANGGLCAYCASHISQED